MSIKMKKIGISCMIKGNMLVIILYYCVMTVSFCCQRMGSIAISIECGIISNF